MAISPLEPFGNIKTDLLYWIKEYLANKLSTLKIDPSFTITFNREASKDRIFAAKHEIELDLAIKEIRRKGMKNLGIYSVPILTFYRYTIFDCKLNSIKDIDTSIRDAYFLNNPSGLKSGTLNSYLIQINSLFGFIEKNNQNLLSGESYRFNLGKTSGGSRAISPIVANEMDRKYLLSSELEQFLGALEKYQFRTENPSQIRLMIKLMCFGALRTEEAASLKYSQLIFMDNPSVFLPKDKYLRIDIKRKSGKRRFVYVKASHIEKDYTECLKHHLCDNEYVFCTFGGERYSNRTPYDIVARIVEAARISTKITPNSLRVSFAAWMMVKNVDFAVISELLGHESEELAELYMQTVRDGSRKIGTSCEDIEKYIKN